MNVENVYLVFGREIKYGQKNYSPNDNHVDSGELLCVNATLQVAQAKFALEQLLPHNFARPF